jgi:Putative Ig domain./Immunoglobulin I-set domain.
MNHISLLSVALSIVVTMLGCATTTVANSGIPVIRSISPSQVVAGGTAFTLSVYGSGFVGNAVVLWNGSPRATQFISKTHLQASISSIDIQESGSANVTVTDQRGNALLSNSMFVTIHALPSLGITTSSLPAGEIAGSYAAALTAKGGSPPYSWGVILGSLPPGLALSASTGAVTGTPTASGQYSFTVQAKDSATSPQTATKTFTIGIAAAVAPSITTQPESQTVTAGQAATFSVVATGTPPLSYQWKKNGTSISGATSSRYATPNTATSDAGSQFTVTVSNSAGSVTSNAAILTVNAILRQLTVSASNLSFGNVNVDTSSSQIVTVTNSGNSNITIAGVIFSGAGFSVSGLSNGLILGPRQTATLNVTFAPAATGSVTGSVTITSDAANSPASVGLSGMGVQPVTRSATLNWIASPTPGVTGYNVYRATTSGGYTTPSNPTPISGTQFTDSTVQLGQTYYYVVNAIDAAGVESPYSNEVSGTIP